jgi:hypothetical protein
MQNNVKANLELALNFVIAISMVVVAGVLVKRNFFPAQTNPGNAPRIAVGDRLQLPNVDWGKNGKSLVFFLKKDCVYCTNSAPFYRQLIQDASERHVPTMAVLPDSVEVGREYLKTLDLTIENVQMGVLPSYKIPATPAVLFVDNQGIAKSVWFGAAPGQERRMRDELIALFDSQVLDQSAAQR